MAAPEDLPQWRMTRRWLRMQSLVSVLLAASALWVSPVAAWSSMFGSLAAFLPALLFALVLVPRIGGDSAAFLRAAVLAEAGKLLLMVVVCVAVFSLVKPLAAGWFFTGMLLTMVAGWVGLIFRV